MPDRPKHHRVQQGTRLMRCTYGLCGCKAAQWRRTCRSTLPLVSERFSFRCDGRRTMSEEYFGSFLSSVRSQFVHLCSISRGAEDSFCFGFLLLLPKIVNEIGEKKDQTEKGGEKKEEKPRRADFTSAVESVWLHPCSCQS